MNFQQIDIPLSTKFATGDLKLYYTIKIQNTEQIRFVIYVGSKSISVDEYNRQDIVLPGFIESVINIKEWVLYILYVNSDLSRKGIATLLFLAAVYMAHGYGLETVCLDDNSSGYRSKSNIYLNLGLEYNEDYGPEMTGRISEIVKLWSKMDAKYGYLDHSTNQLPDSEIFSILSNILRVPIKL